MRVLNIITGLTGQRGRAQKISKYTELTPGTNEIKY